MATNEELINDLEQSLENWFKIHFYVQVDNVKNVKIEIRTEENNHNIPHFHVSYQNAYSASFTIETGEKLAGANIVQYDRIVKDWILQEKNKLKLIQVWNRYHPDKAIQV